MISNWLAAALGRRNIHYGWVMVGVTFLTMLIAAGTVGAPGVFIAPLQKRVRLDHGRNLFRAVDPFHPVRAHRSVRGGADEPLRPAQRHAVGVAGRPLIAESLLSRFGGNVSIVAVYFATVCAISLIAVFLARETRARQM